MNARVEIDADLLAQAVAASGLGSDTAAVEEALRRLLLARRLEALDKLRGLGWDGDLHAMREDRLPDEGV